MAQRGVGACTGSHRTDTRALPPKSASHPRIPGETLEVCLSEQLIVPLFLSFLGLVQVAQFHS